MLKLREAELRATMEYYKRAVDLVSRDRDCRVRELERKQQSFEGGLSEARESCHGDAIVSDAKGMA